MWNDTPLDTPFVCTCCKRDGASGPFWIGPALPTGQAGMFGPSEARISICRECVFLLVNEPGSPFQGWLPRAETAAETERALRADVARLAAEKGMRAAQRSEAPEVAVAVDTITAEANRIIDEFAEAMFARLEEIAAKEITVDVRTPDAPSEAAPAAGGGETPPDEAPATGAEPKPEPAVKLRQRRPPRAGK